MDGVRSEPIPKYLTVEPRPELFLLQNNNGGYVGNSPVFWREGGSGYTMWIDDAKRWTKEEADVQIRSTRGSHSWTMWPISMIERAAKRTVDMQHLHRLQKEEVTNGN